MSATVNYNLPLFTPNGAIDLVNVYNTAMQTIDGKLKEALTNSEFVKSESDKVLTVAQLAAAKVTKDGIIYYVAG
jgi:hypothetical protein